jgi:hypothetical protein
MTRRQFRVLYREFLFRIVDRDLLSTHATGDASQLLLQLVALLVFLSLCVCAPVLFTGTPAPAHTRLIFAWTFEHFLIATTMLVIGVFAVLSWNAMFPGHGDVLVLGPLPIRAHTILLARLAAVATALGLTILALHVAAGMVWPLALASIVPDIGGTWAWPRVLGAYWLTMAAAGVFIFGVAMTLQGVAAAVLPRRHFLRVSSLLQLAAFCVIVGVYLLQPMRVEPDGHLAILRQGLLSWSPSYWFLGLFQQLSGSTALAPLARNAWIGLGLAVSGAAMACALSYLRTLPRIAEEPDIAPAVTRVRWLPAFGNALQTVVVQFSVRTLFRSNSHRVILAFYWGVGCAFVLVFLKSPTGQRETSVPLLLSSIVIMVFAVLAARIAFGMPRDLQANWIFRTLPVRGGPRYIAARRRALVAVSAVPAWIVSAVLFLWMWPWRQAVGHLAALALFGMILVEIAVAGTQRIPFTCSYLPGKSRVHLAACVGALLVLPVVMMAAAFERDALRDTIRYAVLMGALLVAWIAVRGGIALVTSAEPEFEDEPAGQLLTLEIWDGPPRRSETS